MQLFLFIMAAGFAVSFIINNLVRTVLRQRDIRRPELILAFFVTLLGAAALIIDNRSDAQLSFLEQAMLLLIIPMIIVHIGLTVVELVRPQRLKGSRGLFGIGIAVLLLLANFSYSYISLQAELNSVNQNIRPTPVNSLSQRDPCEVAFESIFRNILVDITNAIGLDFDDLLARVEEVPNLSIADLVEANGGSADDLISESTASIQAAIRDLLARGCIESGQATAVIFGAPALVNQFLTSDFQSLLEMANQGGDDDSLIELSEVDIAATNEAFRDFIEQRPSALPSITPTYTPSRTPTATVTRTPRPTDSPTPTRERFATATPTLTPTLPNPCLASANYNVNMRDYPDLEESNVLVTIPYEASFTVYAPNEEQTWWYAQYEGEVGWVSGEYIRLASNCYELPPRRP